RMTAGAVNGIGRRTINKGFDELMSVGCRIIYYFLNSDSVSLTFDDGPNPHSTSKLLAQLEHQEVSATFYCVGQNVARYPDIAKRIAISGHEMGNHSMI